MDLALIGFGLGVGILVGMTGIGGGSLMTPLLILVFGVKPITAIGTDLAYAAITKTVGGYKHWRQKTVDTKLSTWMALGSVPAAVGGVYVLDLLERATGRDFDELLLTLLAGALLLTGTATLVRSFLKRFHERERRTVPMERRHKVAAVALGVFVGFVLGVTSAGSGALIAVGLILLFRLVPTRVVGTDVFHAAILLWAAAAAHVVAGNVDFPLAANILVGSVPGVWMGSHWSIRVHPAVLRTTLAVVLIGAGTALLAKAGLGIPPIALVPFPLGVIVLMVVTIIRERRARLRAAASASHTPEPAAAASPAAHALTQEVPLGAPSVTGADRGDPLPQLSRPVERFASGRAERRPPGTRRR